jgi:predicted phosphodiesterase
MTQYQIMSDLHLEWHKDQGKSFIDALPVCAYTLILAGDICGYSQIRGVLERFSKKWKNVVYVAGNHEYYGMQFNNMGAIWSGVHHNLDNVHWLEFDGTLIDGQRIHGGTLWFNEHPSEPRVVNDFTQIRMLEPAVYDRNLKTRQYFYDSVEPGDVVVTHHTPSYQSQSERWAAQPGGCWFHNNLDSLMYEKEPRLWVHGHTHDSLDYTIHKTRIVCNPFGYVRYQENPDFKEDLVVEI